jgi:hypothetical protein
MGLLIRCVAEAFVASPWWETAPGNKDPWIDDLWACYHPYGNYGAYCVVSAYAIVAGAYDAASRLGRVACLHAFPTRPTEGSTNRERTLYGNVYRTYQEIAREGVVAVGAEPEVGAVFFRASNDAGYNHAGVVIDVPRTTDVWLRTVEANTSVSGGAGIAKGFAVIEYSKAAYERYLERPFTKPADAGRHYGGETLRGWRYAYFNRGCAFTAPIELRSFVVCPGVTVTCVADQPAPAPPSPPTCDITQPPAPQANDADYTPWTLFTNEYPKTLLPGGMTINATTNRGTSTAVGMQLRPSRDLVLSGAVELSGDGCWIRYRKADLPARDGSVSAQKLTECKEALLERSACDPDDGQGKRTVLRFPSKGDIITLADMTDRGARESLFSSVIPRNDFMGRGYDARVKAAFDMVPMLQMENAQVFNLVESSELYNIFEQLKLWGPNPHILRIDRLSLQGGVGGGYAERLAAHYSTESQQTFILAEQTETAGLRAQFPVQPLYKVSWDGNRQLVGMYPQATLRSYLETYDRSQADAKRPLVVVWTGEPTTTWDAIRGPLGFISGLIPGIGPVVSRSMTVIDNIINGRGTAIDLAFSLTNALATALGEGTLGEKPFGVDATVFRDIADNARRASAVYKRFQEPGSILAKAAGIAGEFGRQFPSTLTSLRETFANEERWLRNAAGDIERVWNGALGDIRSTVHGVADGIIHDKMIGLTSIAGGIDTAFATVAASAVTAVNSASQLWFVQELLTTKPDASMLGAMPGVHRIVANILGVESFFRQDVGSPVTHASLAAIATGRKVLDGALDGLTLASLINKAEDFARKGWDFTLPMTLPPEKRDCFAHEIRVVTGLECCAPRKLYCGTCLDPTEVAPCPQGQMRDADGCCVEIPRLDTSGGGSATAGGDVDAGGSGMQTTPRPSVIPDCIRVIGGRYMYCPPPTCAPRSSTTTSKPPVVPAWEEAVVHMVNDNGAPFQLRAKRPVGTSTWQDWATRPMQPMGNEWIESTLAFTPVGADGILNGLTMTAGMFDAMRVQQQAPLMPTEAPTGGLSAAGIGGPMTLADLGLGADMLLPMTSMPDATEADAASSSTPSPATTSTPMMPPADGSAPCAFMYEARFSPDPYERWYARIGTTWTEIVDCCPAPQSGECCAESIAIAKATQRDVMRLMEHVLRMGQGEPITTDDVRRDLAEIKQTLAFVGSTRYDDTQLLARLSALEQAVREIRMPEAYDDAIMRRDIAEVKQLVEARCVQSEGRNYDLRFDALESLLRSIVIPPPVVTNEGVTVTGPDYTPILLQLQRAIAELRSAPAYDYDARFAELRTMIARLPLTCPTCSEADMTEITSRLERIEQQTTRNYDARFAELRSMMEDLRQGGTSATDERLANVERVVMEIRDRESRDYAAAFERLEALLGDIRVVLGRERSYDQWFEAITARLDALRLPATTTNCDYRWDEVVRLLQEIRTPSPTGDTAVDTRELQSFITAATERVVTLTDRRYDDLRMVVDGLRTMLAVRGEAPDVEHDDERFNEILRLLDALQVQTSTMTTALQQAERDLGTLRGMQERMEAAFAREIGMLQTAIRTDGGDAATFEALRQAREELTYQRNRYEHDIDYLQRRLAACATTAAAERSTAEREVLTPTTRQSADGSMHTVEERSHAAVSSVKATDEQGRIIDVVRPADNRGTGVDCTDCPAMIERHERIYYRFPEATTSGEATHADEECDDGGPCDDGDPCID